MEGRWVPEAGRHASVYVFAWHGGTGTTADQRDPATGEFYVVAERDLPEQKPIALKALQAPRPRCAASMISRRRCAKRPSTPALSRWRPEPGWLIQRRGGRPRGRLRRSGHRLRLSLTTSSVRRDRRRGTSVEGQTVSAEYAATARVKGTGQPKGASMPIWSARSSAASCRSREPAWLVRSSRTNPGRARGGARQPRAAAPRSNQSLLAS